jgi:Putative peptidoglycan binding domain
MKLRNVMKGATGPDVKAIQEGLNKYYKKRVLAEDGVFGKETEKVVRRFQESEGMIPPDGIVGPITRSALFPLVAVTANFWGTRFQGRASPLLGVGETPGAYLNLGFGMRIPALIPLPLPPGLVAGLSRYDLIQPPGSREPVLAPTVATPPGGRIVVDWQQIMQTQRQFDGLFKNQQDSFAIGLQSVFKRRKLNPNESHLEIATGCLLQSPIGFQDSRGNDFTIGCFAQATWVESLGESGIFAWAPYVQAQGQGNPTGPPTIIGSTSLFPIALNVDLGKIGFDDVTLQAGAGAIGSLKFTSQGLVTTWGSQFGIGLQGKVWFMGN